MNQQLFDQFLLIVIGAVFGAIVATVTVVSSYSKTIKGYEALIDRIDEDNPGYIDNILCETDEWGFIYGE